jgi:hypothetical protein
MCRDFNIVRLLYSGYIILETNPDKLSSFGFQFVRMSLLRLKVTFCCKATLKPVICFLVVSVLISAVH